MAYNILIVWKISWWTNKVLSIVGFQGLTDEKVRVVGWDTPFSVHEVLGLYN